MRYSLSKSEATIGSLWTQTKNTKKTISLKIYLLLHFLSNLLQIFTESVLLNFKKIECRNFFNFEKKKLSKKNHLLF